MEIPVIVLIVSFVVLLVLNVPIAISIGVATILTMLFTIAPGPAITTVAQQMATGINKLRPDWRFRFLFFPVCLWDGAELPGG